MHVDQEVDTRGLNCPLPILKAKSAGCHAAANCSRSWPMIPAPSGTSRPLPSRPAMSWSSSRRSVMNSFTSCADVESRRLTQQRPAFAGLFRIRAPWRAGSEAQAFEVLAKAVAHYRGAAARQLHRGLQKTFLAAAVIAFAGVLEGVDGLVLHQALDGIGQLNLRPRPGAGCGSGRRWPVYLFFKAINSFFSKKKVHHKERKIP